MSASTRDIWDRDLDTYDRAVFILRDQLGSFESIANECRCYSGVFVSSNTVRGWFLDRRIPIEYAAVFHDLTEGDVSVLDFFPYLDQFIGDQ